MKAESRSAADMRDQLLALFPGYRTHWESPDNPFTAEDGTFSHHGLMIDFTDLLGRNVRGFSEKQIGESCRFIDVSVSIEGPLENAVSTCLLEHLHQIGAWRTLGHRLSKTA